MLSFLKSKSHQEKLLEWCQENWKYLSFVLIFIAVSIYVINERNYDKCIASYDGKHYQPLSMTTDELCKNGYSRGELLDDLVGIINELMEKNYEGRSYKSLSYEQKSEVKDQAYKILRKQIR